MLLRFRGLPEYIRPLFAKARGLSAGLRLPVTGKTMNQGEMKKTETLANFT